MYRAEGMGCESCGCGCGVSLMWYISYIDMRWMMGLGGVTTNMKKNDILLRFKRKYRANDARTWWERYLRINSHDPHQQALNATRNPPLKRIFLLHNLFPFFRSQSKNLFYVESLNWISFHFLEAFSLLACCRVTFSPSLKSPWRKYLKGLRRRTLKWRFR